MAGPAVFGAGGVVVTVGSGSTGATAFPTVATSSATGSAMTEIGATLVEVLSGPIGAANALNSSNASLTRALRMSTAVTLALTAMSDSSRKRATAETQICRVASACLLALSRTIRRSAGRS